MQNHFGIQNLWMVKNLSLKFKRIPLAMRLLVLFFACAMILRMQVTLMLRLLELRLKLQIRL